MAYDTDPATGLPIGAYTPPTITIAGKARPIRWLHVIGMDDPIGFRFPAQHMRSADTVTEITIHESVTTTVDGMRRAFTRGGGSLGVHFSIDTDGTIRQHADPAYHVLYHAKGHNRQGVGIEVINPYHPGLLPAAQRQKRVILDTVWAAKGKDGKRGYVVPTLLQLEALWSLVCALTENDSGLRIPPTMQFPGCIRGRFRMTQIEAGNDRIPGIWAHGQQFSLSNASTSAHTKKQAHADGFFPVLYCLIRRALAFAPQDDVSPGNEPDVAYTRAMVRAEKETDAHRRIIVGDLTGEALCATD